jgi:putative ABC transport system ATP-binding protein
MIDVQNITKIYTEGIVMTKALNDVSFSIVQGEFVGLMGRSGSGKSTLLHQLGLLDIPTSGSISINGTPLSELSPEEKTDFRLTKIGYVFQEYGLIAEFTALENVMFPRMAMIDGADQEKAKELLLYVGLGERLHHYPDEMSGGEKQRVAIARALVNDPDIIIADEPTANLDSISTEAVLLLFKRMHQEFKKTIIMVTHEESDKKYMDRIIFLKDGKILSEESLVSQERKGAQGVLRP